MMMYVLSFCGNGNTSVIDGVYGVFDSIQKAFLAVGHYCDAYDELIYDFENGERMWRFFTNKGTYAIEAMPLNDEGI